MERIYLSRRNLLTLLSKLDRLAAGEETACTIIKYDNQLDPYRGTLDMVEVIAIPDEKYYTDRHPGQMHPKDAPEVPSDPNNIF
jgi:hypothetical protein